MNNEKVSPAILNANEERYYRVGFRDVQNVVKSLYGVDIDVRDMLGADNDSIHSVWISTPLDEHEQKQVDKWLKNKPELANADVWFPSINVIFSFMCSEGHIKPGNYIISVCW